MFAGPLLCALSVACVWYLIRQTPPHRKLLWSANSVSLPHKLLAGLAGCLFVRGVWLVAHGLNGEGFTRFPSPLGTLIAAFDLLVGGGLWDIGWSAWRVFVGFGIAAAASVLLAYGIALSSITTLAYDPPLSFIRYIPPTAFTALLVIYLGTGEVYKIGLIFVGVFFFNFRMSLDILEDFDVRCVLLARLAGEAQKRGQSTLWRFSTTVVPWSLPRLWDVLRINLSFAWTFLVVAELNATEFGLGKVMQLARRQNEVELVWACMLLFGVIGLLTDQTMAQIKRILFPWHDDATSS